MRKFYTILALGAVALSATAATPKLHRDIQKNVVKTERHSFEISQESAMKERVVMHKAPGQEAGIAGDYVFVLGDYYNGEDSEGSVRVSGNIVDNGDGTITLDCEWFVFPVNASYDATTQEVVFTGAQCGLTDFGFGSYYVGFEIGYWDQQLSDIVKKDSLTVTYDVEEESLEFPYDHNFGWKAFEDADYSKVAGYLMLFDVEVFYKDDAEPYDEVQEGQWQDVGNATFVDAWVTTAYSSGGVPLDPRSTPFEVQLQQNVENNNIYRLWGPYHADGFILADQNTSEYIGQIVFDVTDPDHVRFKCGVPAGYYINGGEIYCYDLLGYQINSLGEDWNESLLPKVYEFMEQYGQPFSTYKDGVVTVNKSVFCLSVACDKAYTWNGASTYVSTITFPGVNTGVEAVEAAAEGEAVYYNLQGARVANPEGVVICVKNGKAVKTLVK